LHKHFDAIYCHTRPLASKTTRLQHHFPVLITHNSLHMEHNRITTLKGRKLWLIAKSRPHHTSQKTMNGTVEFSYKKLLAKVKELSPQAGKAVFERDYRYDGADSAAIMHAYMSPSIYLLLECDYRYDYHIEYAFNDSRLHSQLSLILTGFPFESRAQPVALKPDYNTFYSNVLAYQPKDYISKGSR